MPKKAREKILFAKKALKNFISLKNVWVTGEIPRRHEDATLKDSFLIRDDRREDDKILDDMALAVKTSEGVALILGCCHAGLLNTVEHVENVCSDEVKFVVGGMHLMDYSDEKVREIAKSLDIELIAPCHCTGYRAEMILASMFGERFVPVGAGSVLEIPR